MIITSYNIFQKVTFQETDISNQYQRAYNADKYYLESNNQTIKKWLWKSYRKNKLRKVCYW